MVTNKILIIFLSIIALIILYFILKKDIPKENFLLYENFVENKKFEVQNENKKKFINTNITGLSLGEIHRSKFGKPFAKPQKYNKYFDELRKNKPLSITYEDPLFSDVITYENDHVNNKTGLEECLKKCDGSCIEYGQTSIAHCFPNPKGQIAKSTYYEVLRDKSYNTENYDEKQHQLKFPNMR